MPSESDKWGWKHVSVFGGFDKGSGTKRWKCHYCNIHYNGSYSRVRAHLLGFTGRGVKSCAAIDKSLREAFQILEERVAGKKKRTSRSGKPGKCIRPSESTPTCISRTAAKEDVDGTIARFFYANGLNLNAVNSPYFHKMAKAIAAFGPGYEPPSIDKLSDYFLRKEKARIEKAMGLTRKSWPHTACTILCANCLDGTTECFRVNIFISCPRAVLFLRTVDIDKSNGAELVFANVLSDTIMEIGPKNVLQIISSLSHANESYISIYSKFPHIVWSPCTLLSVRILMDNIAEMDCIKHIMLCAKGIDQCIRKYKCSSLSGFTQDMRENFDPISSNFAPSYCILRRVFELKLALQEVAVSKEWKQWRHTTKEDISNIEAAILGDKFWGRAHMFLQLFEPFIRLLYILNTDKSVIGDVYFWMSQALLEATRTSEIDDDALNQLEVIILSRWDSLFSPLHATGYILNPRYFGRGQTEDKTVMRGWKATLERYEHDSSARRILREQLSSYCRQEGSLGEEDAVDSRDKMDPVSWWENFGFETPHLQTLAVQVLSQPSSLVMCADGGRSCICPEQPQT